MMMKGLITLLVTLPLVSVSVVQKFVREPPDQTAAEGEHVTLPCRVENKVTETEKENILRERELLRHLASGRTAPVDQGRLWTGP